MDIFNADLFWILFAIAGIATWLWIRSIRRDVDAMQQGIKEIMNKIVFMRIEEDGNMMYAYNAITNEFICQGKNMDELNETFGIRFPSSRGVLIREEKGEHNDVQHF